MLDGVPLSDASRVSAQDDAGARHAATSGRSGSDSAAQLATVGNAQYA